ncbi:hypothetical protein RLIN73S_01663 [Rhodanobacter lindaniclasticus]
MIWFSPAATVIEAVPLALSASCANVDPSLDTFGGEAGAQLPAEGVVTERTNQGHFGTESRGGHGLVGALAARYGEEALAEEIVSPGPWTQRVRLG